MSKEFQSKPSVRDAYQQLSALDSAQGNFRQAYDYHQLYVAMKDSVLNEETKNSLVTFKQNMKQGKRINESFYWQKRRRFN